MNLLPITEKDILKKGLQRRSLIVASIFIGTSFLIGFIMLLPSYFLTAGYFSPIDLNSAVMTPEAQKENEELLALPKEIDAKLKFLQTNNNSESATSLLLKVITLLPEKVIINSISLIKNQTYKEKSGSMLTISGIASNREALVLFSNNLRESKTFSSVDVPVSSLAKDKDLPFSINIFIENQK